MRLRQLARTRQADRVALRAILLTLALFCGYGVLLSLVVNR